MRALNERRAHLKGDGSGAPIELSACSNWVLSGLYAEGIDFTAPMPWPQPQMSRQALAF